MKSLEIRQRERKKDREAEEKARKQNGNFIAVAQETDADGEAEPLASDGMSSADADKWVDDTVEAIKANLSDLSDEDLNAIEAAEGRAKDRVSVKDAISKERDARKAKGSDWNPNA